MENHVKINKAVLGVEREHRTLVCFPNSYAPSTPLFYEEIKEALFVQVGYKIKMNITRSQVRSQARHCVYYFQPRQS